MQVALEALASQANQENDKLIILLVDRAGCQKASEVGNTKEDRYVYYPWIYFSPESDRVSAGHSTRESLANKPFNERG